ncbi:MAG TPA: alpha/beta hydrolase [Verrucomicrobiae bacterium]|jgi:acetyl esterase/lipase|nr:alpha/beta hydrolase [Verrucomicrobiae bacterium]
MSDDILMLAPPAYDERVVYGADLNQFVDLRLPKQAAKKQPPKKTALVINIHGGFWRAKYDLQHAGHLCAALTKQGLATANLEYRRVGNDGGGWPGTFEDIRSGYRYLLQNAGRYNFDESRVLVMGHSAGGQLALCLAAHEANLTRVVSLAGVVDLKGAYELHLSNNAVVEFLHGTPSQVPDHYREADPVQLAIRDARQVLIHGRADDIVPPDFGRSYADAKKHENVRLIQIAGAGHFDLIDPRSAAWDQVEDAVKQLLV